jgi:Uma2 family endonuclease
MFDVGPLAPEAPRRLRRAEYDAIAAMGVLGDDRVELIVPALAERARVRIQLPIVAADDSEPEPDVVIVLIGDDSREHPAAAYLIIEVADSSLRKDVAVAIADVLR